MIVERLQQASNHEWWHSVDRWADDTSILPSLAYSYSILFMLSLLFVLCAAEIDNDKAQITSMGSLLKSATPMEG